MNVADQLREKLAFGFRSRLPIILQTEATECGLACLAMIASYHGYRTDLASLRREFSISMKGASLTDLMRTANSLNMATRPLKLDMPQLSQLKTPCILHWNFNHFVVLKEVGLKFATIHDPDRGIRKLPLDEVSKSFTGVALECWPNERFRPKKQLQRIELRSLMGKVTGLWRSLGQIFALALVLELFVLAMPLFTQWIFDEVVVTADQKLLTTVAIGYCLTILLKEGIAIVRSWVVLYMSTTLSLQWQANVFSHLLRLPVQYFEKRHLGDVVSRFESVQAIQKILTTSFIEAIMDGLMTIITVIMMLVYSPTLTMIALATMALYALSRIVFYKPLYNASEEEIVHHAKQESHFLETIRGIKTIKLFQRQEQRRLTWLSLLVDQTNARLASDKLHLLFKLLNGVLFGVEGVLILWLGVKLIISGGFTVGVLIAFIAYKDQFGSAVSNLIDKLFELKMVQLQAERLADIVFTEPEKTEGEQKSGKTHELSAMIEVRNLHFRYGENEPYVLEGINLKINEGESVAIIGPSGGGKTTLVNVMLGVLSPTKGDVLIGGVNVKQVGVDTLRRMVGTVMQDDVLFAGSVAENISFFDTEPDLKWIETCARMAAVDEDIEAMPMRYNTLVGDMGTSLSGGQKQRILLARALYKRPKVLFLDEATSALDVEREHMVNYAIQALNITRVIIAHRPETIAMAGRAVRLQYGTMSEASPFDDEEQTDDDGFDDESEPDEEEEAN